MSGADGSGGRLSLRRDEVLRERYALVSREHWIPSANLTITVSHRRGYMRDFESPRLALSKRAAKSLKSLEEERFDIVRLQSARVSAFHLLAYACHAARIHRIVCKRSILDQVLQVWTIHAMFDGTCEARANLGLVTIADGFNQEFAERPSFEL
jgi:hypothetical protein